MAVNALHIAAPQPMNQPDQRLDAEETALVIRFAAAEAGRLKYDHRENAWYFFESHVWRPSTTIPYRRLQDFLQLSLADAGFLMDQRQREDTINFYKRQLRASQIPRLLTHARHQEAVVAATAWNQDRLLLGVENGVIDLRTGTFRPGRPDDLVTRLAGTKFDPQAECPRFDRFLDELSLEAEDRAFLVRALGYMLSGETREQCFFLLLGQGANGKSTLLRVLRALLGEYVRPIAFSSLISRRNHGGEQPHSDLAALQGARLLIASEVTEGARLDEGRLKYITGEDDIACRHLYGRWFSYTPEFKLVAAANVLPSVADTSPAFWRRVRLLEFPASFSPREQDPDLGRKLLAELPGILNLAIRGCREWQREGLRATSSMISAATGWKEENDLLSQFLASPRVILADGQRASSGDIYSAFEGWAAAAGIPRTERLSWKAAGAELKRRFKSVKPGGRTYYIGIGLAPGNWE